MKLPKPLKRRGNVIQLPISTSTVRAGQRWLITRARLAQVADVGAFLEEDFTFTVEEVYVPSERELRQYDVVTASAMRGERYAVLRDPDDDFYGLQLPTSLLIELGELVTN